MDDATLLQLAEKELLGEAKRAAIRYSVAGPSGWNPCPLKKTNKTFLANTLLQTISSNRIRDLASKNKKPKKVRERKLLRDKNAPGMNMNNCVFKKPEDKNSDKPVVKNNQDSIKAAKNTSSNLNNKNLLSHIAKTKK